MIIQWRAKPENGCKRKLCIRSPSGLAYRPAAIIDNDNRSGGFSPIRRFFRLIMKLKILFISALALAVTCCSCDNKQGVTGTLPEAPECMVRFEKNGAKEYFNVAVRDQYKDYIWYVFRINHYLDHSAMKYMDLWRIDWAYQGEYDEATGEMENILDRILTEGESECVIKDYGQKRSDGAGYIDTDDFTGGFHGDERIDLQDGCGVTFYIDDQPLTAEELSGSFGWRPCGKFHYVQNSTMHKTALKSGEDGAAEESDHHVVAEHRKTTMFGNSGYVTENTLVMKDAIDFYWHNGICCVGTSVAELGYNEDMEIVEFDRKGGNKLSGKGHSEYTAWSNDHAIEAHVKTVVTEGADDSESYMYIWDTTYYAKYYRRWPANGAHTASDGERFSSRMTVTFATR